VVVLAYALAWVGVIALWAGDRLED